MLQPGMTRAILLAHGHRCVYCGHSATEADHIVPKNLGGSDDSINLVAACRKCNATKSDNLLDKGHQQELLQLAYTLSPFVEQALQIYKQGLANGVRLAKRLSKDN